MSKDVVSQMVASYVAARLEELRQQNLYEAVEEADDADREACAAFHVLKDRLAEIEDPEEVKKNPLSSLQVLLTNINNCFLYRETLACEILYKAGLSDGYKLRESLNVPADKVNAVLGIDF